MLFENAAKEVIDKIKGYKHTDEAIQKMPDAAAILLFNSTFNAERLERDQSTNNYSVISADLLAMQTANRKRNDDAT